MKKKIFAISIIISLLYILWPFYSLYKFYVAAKKSDIIFFSNNVDWKSLRMGFKDDLKIVINKRIGKENNLEKKLLKTLLGNSLIEIVLDEIISPESIVLLLNNPNEYKKILQNEIENPTKEKKEKNVSKKKFKLQGPNIQRISEKINYIFFINPITFRIDFNHDNYPIIADLKLDSFKWKIKRIYLPINHIVSKI